MRRKHFSRRLPQGKFKPLTLRKVLSRLSECACVLDPKIPMPLSSDDVELVEYNFALAKLFVEVKHFTRSDVSAIGFNASNDRPEDVEEDDEDDTEDGDESAGGLERWSYEECRR